MGLTWGQMAARLHIDPLTVSWVFIPFAACLLTSWFCWRRGDGADRLVAASFSLCWFGSLVSIWTSAVVLDDVRPPLFWRVVWDAGMALVFLWAAIGRRKRWYGVAPMAQGLQMAVNTVDISLHEPSGTLSWAFFYLGETMNLVMMGAMLGQVLDGRSEQPVLR